MAECEHNRSTFHGFLSAVFPLIVNLLYEDGGQCRPAGHGPNVHIVHLRIKTHFSAQPYDFFANVLHGLPQYIRTDMRFLLVKNIVRCPCFCKFFEDLCDSEVLRSGCQLAVTESSGSAFAELHIRLRIEPSLFPESSHRCSSVFDFLSPLQNNRSVSCLCKNQSSKHSRRPKSDDYRSFLKFRSRIIGLRKPICCVGRHFEFYLSVRSQSCLF